MILVTSSNGIPPSKQLLELASVRIFQVFMLGGEDDTGAPQDDFFSLNIDTFAWTQLEPIPVVFTDTYCGQISGNL